MKNKLPVIIDTDMGIDDALAMLVALRSDKLDIKLITTVSGNVKIEQVNKNILFMLAFEIQLLTNLSWP